MMRRLLYFLHISSLLCRTTVCSLVIGGFLCLFCGYFSIFARYRPSQFSNIQ